MAGPTSQYGLAIELLSRASRGIYQGPVIPEAHVRTAYETIEGLDTGALRIAGHNVVGHSDATKSKGWLVPVITFIAEVGVGMVATELLNRAREWFDNSDEAEEVGDAASKAADAIDTTVVESDQGIEQILAQLVEIIHQLSTYLAGIDPREAPDAFAQCVQASSDLINQAAEMVCGLCQDRDTAINGCFSALIDHGNQVCAQPLAPTKTLIDEKTHSSTSSSSVASSVSTTPAALETAEAAEAVEKVVKAEKEEEEKPIEDKPQSLKPDKEEDDCDEKSEKDPEPEEITKEEADPEPLGEQEPSNNMWFGILGFGVIAIGVGFLVTLIEQALSQPLTIEDVVVDEPAAIKPELAPESSLAAVKEPPAKPIPVAETPQVAKASFLAAPVPSAPAPTIAPPDVPEVNVRKAGGW